jgi:hypothetical protein
MSWWSPVSAALSCQRRLYPSRDVVSTSLAGSPKASPRSLKTEQCGYLSLWLLSAAARFGVKRRSQRG